jgi:hypothetical protein
MTLVNGMYVYQQSNTTPSNDVVLDSGELSLSAFSLTINRNFSLNGTFARISLIPRYGTINATTESGNGQYHLVEKTGPMDASVLISVGLINTPVLNISEIEENVPRFQLYSLLELTIPVGRYDQSDLVNLGANRWAFRVGMPMVIPLNKDKQKMTLWEIVPNVYLYTQNKNIFMGQAKTQNPLLMLEQEVSKVFTKKLWASLDMNYQFGGMTYIDDISTGNNIDQLTAGITIGYLPTDVLTLQARYGEIWFDEDNGHAFRLGISLAIPSKKDREIKKEDTLNNRF